MPIMLPEWVFDVWRISENRYLKNREFFLKLSIMFQLQFKVHIAHSFIPISSSLNFVIVQFIVLQRILRRRLDAINLKVLVQKKDEFLYSFFPIQCRGSILKIFSVRTVGPNCKNQTVISFRECFSRSLPWRLYSK